MIRQFFYPHFHNGCPLSDGVIHKVVHNVHKAVFRVVAGFFCGAAHLFAFSTDFLEKVIPFSRCAATLDLFPFFQSCSQSPQGLWIILCTKGCG
jgi:hypothetical protein